MKQHNSAVIKKDAAQFDKWCFQQTVELEHTKRELENSKREMERHQRELERQKRKFEMEKNLELEQENRSQSSNVVKGEMFFMGVGNEKSLRKRYKDLIKIYHPDNLNGDTGTIQEINREYQVLMQKLEVKYQ